MGPLINGDYPLVMRKKIYEKSIAEGRTESRLPKFTAKQKEFVQGIVT